MFSCLGSCRSVLNDIFVGQSNLGGKSLLFMTLNISCQSYLACKVSFEKSADNFMRNPLYVTSCFSLAAFKIFYLSLTSGTLIIICLRVGLFASILFGTLHGSWTCMSISFTKLRKFSFITFSNRFPNFCSSSCPSGTPMT